MSSMRNAVQRRNHKERAQPTERARWGLLEKHKDYSLRAADHNEKKRKLKALQQKASERNEDEFYFAMVNQESEGGRKRARRAEANGGGTALRREVVSLMKTQDAGYLRTMLLRTKSMRERAEKEVVAAEVGVGTAVPSGSGKKIVFGEDGEDRPALPPLVENGDDDLADLNGLYSDDEAGGAGADNEEEGLDKEEIVARRRKRKRLHAKRRQLDALKDREKQLSTALRQVEDQRARMAGKVGGVNKHGTKFKVRQRK